MQFLQCKLDLEPKVHLRGKVIRAKHLYMVHIKGKWGHQGVSYCLPPPPVPLHPLGIRLQTLLGLLDHLNVSLTQSLAHLLGLWSQDFLTQSPNGSVDVGLNLGLLCQLMPQMMRSLLKVFWRPSLFDARALSACPTQTVVATLTTQELAYLAEKIKNFKLTQLQIICVSNTFSVPRELTIGLLSTSVQLCLVHWPLGKVYVYI